MKEKGYLLDTCICAFFFRKKYGIVEKMSQINPSRCFISDITLAELKYGAYKSGRVKENLELIDSLLSDIAVLPFSDGVDIYAKEKTRLEAQGMPIDEFDLMIASTAIANGLILVTDNQKHFQRVNGLRLENWVNR